MTKLGYLIKDNSWIADEHYKIFETRFEKWRERLTVISEFFYASPLMLNMIYSP